MKLLKQLFAMTALSLTCGTVFAQNDANNIFNGGSATPDISNLCPGCNGQVVDMNNGKLNCDMIEQDPYNAGAPGYQQTIRAVVWSNLEGALSLGGTSIDLAGLWVQESSTSATATLTLPAPNSTPGLNGWFAERADVAVGAILDRSTGQYRYYVVAVYEAGGSLWTEWYDVDISGGGISLVHPTGYSAASPCVHMCNIPAYLDIPTSPRIDLLAAAGSDGQSSIMDYHAYSIAFMGYNTQTSNTEVWYVRGDIYQPAISATFIEEGHDPDVSCVNAVYNTSPAPLPYDKDQAYVTYINGSGDLRLAELDVNGGTPPHTFTTLHVGQSERPTIATAVHYDYNLVMPSYQVATVSCMEFDPMYNNNWRIVSHSLHDPAGTPTVNTTEMSDYGGPGVFYSNDCIYPTTSGVGGFVYNKYSLGGGTSYSDYVTEFYSDYTHHNANNSGSSTNGDFFANYVQITSPFNALRNSVDVDEVNFEDLNAGFAYLAAPIQNPKFDADVSRNSGYDLFSVYYDGLRIFYKTTGGTNYTFKPTEIGAINIATGASIGLYPNPATDVLNVSGADGKDYSILDITGKQVANGTFAGTKADVNINNLAAGSYIMHINTADGAEDLKFVKQ